MFEYFYITAKSFYCVNILFISNLGFQSLLISSVLFNSHECLSSHFKGGYIDFHIIFIRAQLGCFTFH